MPQEERFYIDNPDESITALQLMKTVLPNITRSLYRKITPPEKLYLLGDSARRKVLRAVQAHYFKPPVTPETDEFIPVFHHLSYGVQDRWEVQQQFSSCRWLYGYNDDNQATSHLLHYGWIGKLQVPMGGASMHKLAVLDEGVLVDIEYSHTFNERLQAACEAIDIEIETLILKGKPRLIPEIISAGLQTFFYFKKRYISIDAEYRMNVTNKLTAYIENAINPIRKGPLVRPTIDEPENVIEDQVFILKWEDFEIGEKVSTAKRNQLQDIAAQKALDALLPKIQGLPRGVELTRKELNIHTEVITTAVKYNLLLRPRHGKYIIPEDIDERSNND